MNTSQVDIIVYGSPSEPLALVEVKNPPRLSPAQAAEVRRAVLDDAPDSADRAFVLVISQDAGYLWEPAHGSNGRDDDQPGARFDMRSLLADYLSAENLREHLRGAELE